MLGAGPDVPDPGGHPGFTSGPLPGILGLLVVLITLTVAAEGQLRASQLPPPVRSLRRRVSRARRYLEVTRIMARHGLAPYLSGRSRPSLAPQRASADHESLRPIGSRG